MYFSQLTIEVNWSNYGYFSPGGLNLTSYSVAKECNELEVSVIHEESAERKKSCKPKLERARSCFRNTVNKYL